MTTTTDTTYARTWLVAHDFSAPAAAALDAAVDELLDLPGASRVFLLHVVQPVPMPTGELATLGPELGEVQREARVAARDQLVRVAGACAARAQGRGKRLSVTPVVRVGAATDVILDEAKNHHADRIVVGTHGRRGLGRLLLGSVAEVVARRSTIPVLVVHESSYIEERPAADAERAAAAVARS
jgi:nucleotide-binding universal stress UspA family protein